MLAAAALPREQVGAIEQDLDGLAGGELGGDFGGGDVNGGLRGDECQLAGVERRGAAGTVDHCGCVSGGRIARARRERVGCPCVCVTQALT